MGRFIDTAYLAGEWTNAFGDIARPVESTRFARRSAAEARNQKRARRGALSQAAPARAAFTSGNRELDTLAHDANRALDLAVTVKSSRCTEAITDLCARIQEYALIRLDLPQWGPALGPESVPRPAGNPAFPRLRLNGVRLWGPESVVRRGGRHQPRG